MDASTLPEPNTKGKKTKTTYLLTDLPRSNTGEAKEHPITLKRQLCLKSGQSVWIVCEKPVLMHMGYQLDTTDGYWKASIHTLTLNIAEPASKPFETTTSDAIMIEPKEPLDDQFEKDWNRLPTELKLQVLEPLLIPAEQRHPHLYYKINNGEAIDAALWETQRVWPILHHWMYTGQELCDLARDVFYGRNTFRISSSRLSSRTHLGNGLATCPDYLTMPEVSATPLIRKLQFEMCVTRVEWAKLRRIADKDYGFTGLASIDIIVYLNSNMVDPERDIPGSTITWQDKARQLAATPLAFDCYGSLNVYGVPKRHNVNQTVVDEVKDILKAAITFRGRNA
jgi:hypothetical protein